MGLKGKHVPRHRGMEAHGMFREWPEFCCDGWGHVESGAGSETEKTWCQSGEAYVCHPGDLVFFLKAIYSC